MRRLIPLCLLIVSGALLAQDAEPLIHVVEPGEQIGRLAVIYEVPAEEILAANPLIRPPLTPGQRVLVPRIRRASVPMPALSPAEPPMLPNQTMEAPVASATPKTGSAVAPPEFGFAEAIAIPAAAGIRYNGKWTPPGESQPWVMDCSNTARWAHRQVSGIDIPRTASGQYEWLRKQGRIWRTANERTLRKKLKPGDLLFWEHTYRPVRKPPITHVMVYLGTDAQGRMRMAGSQGSRGVDFYTFDPAAKTGGYRFFLFFRREGRFVGFGRP